LAARGAAGRAAALKPTNCAHPTQHNSFRAFSDVGVALVREWGYVGCTTRRCSVGAGHAALWC
jgi:hypothetical protein